jgi:hypothetical protein
MHGKVHEMMHADLDGEQTSCMKSVDSTIFIRNAICSQGLVVEGPHAEDTMLPCRRSFAAADPVYSQINTPNRDINFERAETERKAREGQPEPCKGTRRILDQLAFLPSRGPWLF